VIWHIRTALFLLPGREKLQSGRIDAISKSGRRGTVTKYMTEMRTANPAQYFCTNHTITRVLYKKEIGFIHFIKKTRPSAHTFKFDFRAEKPLTTARTHISSFLLMVPEGTGERPFSSFLAHYLILLRGQNVFPFFLGPAYFK